MLVKLTEKAIKEVKHIIQEQGQEQDKVALRIKVVGGGCSGFAAKLELDETFSEERDIVYNDQDVKIAIDKRSALYLDNTTVDFIDDLNKRGFFVDIPAAKSRCGCGSSFSF